MVNDLCDSQRKKELITGRHIPIDIYKGYDEVRGKSMVSLSRKDRKNQA